MPARFEDRPIVPHHHATICSVLIDGSVASMHPFTMLLSLPLVLSVVQKVQHCDLNAFTSALPVFVSIFCLSNFLCWFIRHVSF